MKRRKEWKLSLYAWFFDGRLPQRLIKKIHDSQRLHAERRRRRLGR